MLQNAFYEVGLEWKAHSAVGVLLLELWHYVLVGFVLYESLLIRGCDTRDPLLRFP